VDLSTTYTVWAARATMEVIETRRYGTEGPGGQASGNRAEAGRTYTSRVPLTLPGAARGVSITSMLPFSQAAAVTPGSSHSPSNKERIIHRFKAKETGGSMKPKIIIAIILIALGIVAFAYQGITYTRREKVVDLGPIHLTAEKLKRFRCRPLWGVFRSWRHRAAGYGSRKG